MFQKSLTVLGVALLLILASTGLHAQILEIDLSVANQVTITGTSGPASASASGSDTTGVYFENFYGGAGSALSETFVSGDLTNAENPADGTPELFRGGGGSDPGLNLWSWSSDSTVTFTAGMPAFIGSATWTLDAASYADMLSGATAGNVYFPADTEDDVAGATDIGRYRVIVPEPSALSLLSVLGLSFLGIRRR